MPGGTRQHVLLGFVLKADSTAAGGVADSQSVPNTQEHSGSDSTTIVADNNTVICTRVGINGAEKTIAKFDTFFTEEPSLIQLFKATALKNLDGLIDDGVSGAMIVCGGHTPSLDNHIHNIVYAMAIFSLDTLVQSLPRVRKMQRRLSPSKKQELFGISDSEDDGDLDDIAAREKNSDPILQVAVSWYATVESDSVRGQFDQIDVLAACKFSSIAAPSPDSSPVGHGRQGEPAVEGSILPPHRQLLRCSVVSASNMQQVIERVQQEPRLAPLLQSPHAHHGIVLSVLSTPTSASTDNRSKRHTRVLGEVTFMWLGAQFAARLTNESVGERLFGSLPSEPTAFPHLRAMMQQRIGRSAEQEHDFDRGSANTAMLVALAPDSREHGSQNFNSELLRLGNQYHHQLYADAADMAQRPSDQTGIVGGPTGSPKSSEAEATLPANLQRMLTDVFGGGAVATHWFGQVVKLLQQSRQALHSLQHECASLRTANTVLQQERDSAVEAISGTSARSAASGSARNADASGLLASLGHSGACPSPMPFGDNVSDSVLPTPGRAKHAIVKKTTPGAKDAEDNVVTRSDDDEGDDADPCIDQRSMRNMITLLRSRMKAGAVATMEAQRRASQLEAEVVSLRRSAERKSQAGSPVSSAVAAAQSLRTELVAQLHHTRKLESTVRRLEAELAAEKDFVKSEQRRYRRRVKQLKQQLESTNAVCSSVQDALLAQARQAPYSGIIVQPQDFGPGGLIPVPNVSFVEPNHGLSMSEQSSTEVSPFLASGGMLMDAVRTDDEIFENQQYQ